MGLCHPLVEQVSLLNGQWEEWTFLDIAVPAVSLVGAVEVREKDQRE